MNTGCYERGNTYLNRLYQSATFQMHLHGSIFLPSARLVILWRWRVLNTSPPHTPKMYRISTHKCQLLSYIFAQRDLPETGKKISARCITRLKYTCSIIDFYAYVKHFYHGCEKAVTACREKFLRKAYSVSPIFGSLKKNPDQLRKQPTNVNARQKAVAEGYYAYNSSFAPFFASFCSKSPYRFTQLLDLRSLIFRHNALWLAAFYYATLLFLTGTLFLIYAFFNLRPFFRNSTRT
jgi:hypothetical protein